MSHEIFISYAAEDKHIADAVCEAIESHGIKCWYAPRDVAYAQDFEESIVDAIGESRLIILILTSHSNTSAHVKREIQNACLEEVAVPVLPFRIEDIPLNKALRYYIGSVHWLDAVTPPLDTHLQRLVEHVRARLPHESGPLTLLTPLSPPKDTPVEKEEAPPPPSMAQQTQPAPSVETAAVVPVREVREKIPPPPISFSETGSGTATEGPSVPWALLAVPIGSVFLLIVIVSSVLLYWYSKKGPANTKTFSFQTVKLDTSGKVTERKTGTASYFTEDLGNGVTLDMVQIPAGTFLMGSSTGETLEEKPQHNVTVPAFFMGKFEITQAQWRAVALLPKIKIDLDSGQSHWKGDSLPVDQVEWTQAEEFCARLSKKTGRTYRLPSEAEWEYACRAGATTPFGFGETLTMEVANYSGYPYAGAPRQAERHTTVAAGSLGYANAFGLYDMHGNVAEWVLDGPHRTYDGAPTDGSAWYSSGGFGTNPRVLRGGGLDSGYICRCANRDDICEGCVSGTVGYDKGFRVVAVGQPNAKTPATPSFSPVSTPRATPTPYITPYTPSSYTGSLSGLWVNIFHSSERKIDAERMATTLKEKGARVDLYERSDVTSFSGNIYYSDDRDADARKIAGSLLSFEKLGIGVASGGSHVGEAQFFIWLGTKKN